MASNIDQSIITKSYKMETSRRFTCKKLIMKLMSLYKRFQMEGIHSNASFYLCFQCLKIEKLYTCHFTAGNNHFCIFMLKAFLIEFLDTVSTFRSLKLGFFLTSTNLLLCIHEFQRFQFQIHRAFRVTHILV